MQREVKRLFDQLDSVMSNSEMVRLYQFHRLQLRTHVINFRLRLQLFENGVIDYKLQIMIISETFLGNSLTNTEAAKLLYNSVSKLAFAFVN